MIATPGTVLQEPASSVVRDLFVPVQLPNTALPVFGAAILPTEFGNGVFFADPRFDNIFVCFSNGNGLAASCYATR